MLVNSQDQNDIPSRMPYGLDLSDYNNEVKNQLEVRTNQLRRFNIHNSFFQSKQTQDQNFTSFSHYGYDFGRSRSMNSISSHFVDIKSQLSDSAYLPSNLANIFREYNNELASNISNAINNAQFIQVLKDLIKNGSEKQQSQKNDSIDICFLNEIANDDSVIVELLEIYSTLINFATEYENLQNISEPLANIIVLVLQTISVLFDLGNADSQNQYCDEMILSFNSILSLPQMTDLSLYLTNTHEFKEIVKAILYVTILFAQKSPYAQNCFVCFGVQSTLIDNLTNIIRTITIQLQNGNNIFQDLNNIEDIDIENFNLTCSALKEISAYSEKFDDCDISSIIDSFIEIIRLGIENEDNEDGSKITQAVLENCFNNDNKSIPFIIKEAAFNCLIGITNRKSSDSVLLCQKGLHLTLLNILKLSLKFLFDALEIEDPFNCEFTSIDESKISVALDAVGSNWGLFVSSLLRLIGNTVSTQQQASSLLIEDGLIQMMMTLIQLKNCFCSECTQSHSSEEIELEEKNCQSFMSAALWILSNMMTIVPEILIPLIPTNFIQFILSQANDAPVGIKREIAVFLATCVLFFTYERVSEVFDANSDNGSVFFELMDEMISSGRNDIITRCIDALINLALLFSNENSSSQDTSHISYLLTMIDQNGIMNDLEVLMVEGDSIAKRATALYNKVIWLSSTFC